MAESVWFTRLQTANCFHLTGPFDYLSLTAAMMKIIYIVVDFEPCGLTIVKVYLKLQCIDEIRKNCSNGISCCMVVFVYICMHIVACLCIRMSASLAVYVCPPHSACCIRSHLTSYSTLPGDGYSCTFRFVYETAFFLDPFSTCVISCFICVAEETNPFCQRCNICTICTFPRMHENTMPTCHIVHHVLFNVM